MTLENERVAKALRAHQCGAPQTTPTMHIGSTLRLREQGATLCR